MTEREKILKSTFFNYLSKVLPVIISLAYTYLLTNSLGQAGYGLYNYIPAFLTGLIALFGGSFINNILWTFTARLKSNYLFKKIILLTGLIGIFISITSILFYPSIYSGVNENYLNILTIMTIFLLLVPINNVYLTLFKGLSSFGKGLKATLIENIITLIGVIFFVNIAEYGLIGAFISKGIGVFASIIYLNFKLKKLKLTKTKTNFNELKKYGSWNFLMHVLRESTKQIFVIVLGVFVNVALIGQYYLIDKLTKVSISNISTAVQETMLSKNSENYDKRKIISEQTGKAIRITFIINILLGILSIIFIPVILEIFFKPFAVGPDLVILFVLTLIVRSQSPMSGIFDAINETKNNFKIYSLTLILTMIILLPMSFYFSLTGYLFSDFIITELQYLYTLKLLRKENIALQIIPTKTDFFDLIKIMKQITNKIK